MTSVFISYRRQGALKDARGVYERLARALGQDQIFIDLEGIELGVNFVDVLERQLEGCRVMLALIDPNWATMVDRQGRRSIDREGDFVRLEISVALRRRIPVIPILLDNAEMPSAESLPADIRLLTTHNGMALDFNRFDSEIARLLASLRKYLQPESIAPQNIEFGNIEPLDVEKRNARLPAELDSQVRAPKRQSPKNNAHKKRRSPQKILKPETVSGEPSSSPSYSEQQPIQHSLPPRRPSSLAEPEDLKKSSPPQSAPWYVSFLQWGGWGDASGFLSWLSVVAVGGLVSYWFYFTDSGNHFRQLW